MGGKIFSFGFVVIVAILLLCGITFRFKLYHFLYGVETWNRLDPVYDHKEKSYKSTTYLFIGDSRIVQWNIPNRIILSNQRLNYGISGQTSGQVLQRAKDYFENSHADYIFIQVGINDLKIIGFYPERREYICAITIRNIKSLLLLCQERRSIPIFMTIIPPGRVELKRIFFWNKEVNNSVAQVNNIIVSFCESEKIKVFDISKLLSDDGYSIRKVYQKDCLHLNEKGYEYLNLELDKFIETNKLK